MILGLFKKSFFAQITWVILFAIILAIPGFWQSDITYLPESTLFLKLICFFPWLKTIWVYQLTTNLLLVIVAFYLNFALAKHELVHRQNFLPSLLIIALFNLLHPFDYQLLGVINLLIITLAYNFSLKSFDTEKPDNNIFSASILISLATFISYANFIFFPFIWISFFVFKHYSFRFFPMTIIGMIAPYLFFFSWLFWFDKIDLLVLEWDNINGKLFEIIRITGLINIIFMSILGFFVFTSLAKIAPEIPSKIISIRQKTSLSLWLLVFSLYPLLFYPDIISNNYFIIALSGILGYYLRVIKTRRIWIDLLFTSFILLIIFNKYIYASTLFFK